MSAIFVFAIASVSFAAAEKAEMAKPAENTPAEVPKTAPPTIEKLENPSELKEQEKQKEFKELTPEEQKQLKEFEEQEKQRLEYARRAKAAKGLGVAKEPKRSKGTTETKLIQTLIRHGQQWLCLFCFNI